MKYLIDEIELAGNTKGHWAKLSLYTVASFGGIKRSCILVVASESAENLKPGMTVDITIRAPFHIEEAVEETALESTLETQK